MEAISRTKIVIRHKAKGRGWASREQNTEGGSLREKRSSILEPADVSDTACVDCRTVRRRLRAGSPSRVARFRLGADTLDATPPLL